MMRAVNRRSLALSLVLCACGSSEQPLPSIVSVTPASMASDERIFATVLLEGSFPFKVDYASDSASVTPLSKVTIADRELTILRTENKGTRLLTEIAPGLPIGKQELRVELTDGRQVVFADGFEVTPPLSITGLSIDFIQTQIRLRPFPLRVRVQGDDAELYRSMVKLKVSRGTITPDTCPSFSDGVCNQEVTLDDTSGADLMITAEDAAGHTGSSNFFQLRPN